jgi:hypothetical protein
MLNQTHLYKFNTRPKSFHILFERQDITVAFASSGEEESSS